MGSPTSYELPITTKQMMQCARAMPFLPHAMDSKGFFELATQEFHALCDAPRALLHTQQVTGRGGARARA